MIVPDINLMIYAYNHAAPLHELARGWWDDILSTERPVGIPWAVAFGFIRLTTHPAILSEPLAPSKAFDLVESWFTNPAIQSLDPGPRHLRISRDLISATGVAGRLTTDTHLAAIAIEHRCELHSNDSDFGRFPGLRWHNPLAR